MQKTELILCRAKYLLPLAHPDRGERIKDGYILSEGEQIKEVGHYTTDIEKRLFDTYGEKLRVLRPLGSSKELKVPQFNGVLMPAFVKAHGHDHEQPIIGIAKDEPLTMWLDHAVNPFTGFINKEMEKLTELLGASPHLATYRMARVSDIHYGITASMVHHCNHNKYHLKEIAEANEAAGTTMIVAVGGQDRFYFAELLDKPEEVIERLDKALEIPNLTRTSFCPGPDQLFSNSRDVLIPLKAWAKKHNTLFHIHSSEEPKTTQWFQREIEKGFTPVEYAHEIGVLDENSVLAHQVNCGPNDLEILAKTKTKIVHNPLANTILGSGMPPIIEMLQAGIKVAISTDGSGSADNQNILSAAKLAAQYQKAHHQDATLLKSQELLEMITHIPAEILRLNQGELAPKKDADWIIIDLNRPNLTPTRLDNLMENIIWAADGSEISTVVSKGRLLKAHHQVQDFIDGTTPQSIMNSVQTLSEAFAEYRKTAPVISGTGANQ